MESGYGSIHRTERLTNMVTALLKLLLLVLSIAAFVIVILLYSWVAGPEETPNSSSDADTPDRAINLTGIRRIGSRDARLDRGKELKYFGRGVGGRIEMEYSAKEFVLQADDRASLRDVRFVRYLKNGQTLRLNSETGEVRLERGVEPTRGHLRGNVQIVFRFPNPSRTKQGFAEQPTQKLIISTEELEFDTRACRLRTDRAVQLSGPDLDANGMGFLLRWREISREIDRLVIERGGELTWRAGEGRSLSELIWEGDDSGESPGTKTARPAADSDRIHSYLATFEEDVRVTYQNQVVDNLDLLNVLFDLILPSQSTEAPSPSARANGQAPTSPVRAGTQASAPLTESRPSSDLRLTWSRKLTVVPKERHEVKPSPKRKLEVEAWGTPVKFHSPDMSGECARLKAIHRSGKVTLFSSSDFDVSFQAAQGTSVVCKERVEIEP